MTQDAGIVRSYLNSRTSTGLTSPGLYNWPRHAAEDLANFNPEAIIFTIGANDSPLVQPNPKDASGRPAWEANWRRHVTTMMDLFLASRSDRHVYWVGTPNMRDSKFAAKVLQLNKIAREEANRRPNVTYIDAYALFSDSDGRYAAALPGPDGRKRTVRAGDGIHFTNEGGSRLAAEIFRVLDADWSISERAVPGSKRIPQIVSKGSGTQPGNVAAQHDLDRRCRFCPERHDASVNLLDHQQHDCTVEYRNHRRPLRSSRLVDNTDRSDFDDNRARHDHHNDLMGRSAQ